jgi:hypothetical protein
MNGVVPFMREISRSHELKLKSLNLAGYDNGAVAPPGVL